jgi:hypothetical protein
MTTSFSPGADFARVIDDLTPVTLVRVGTPDETLIDSALRQAIRTREAEHSGGRYTSSDVVWHLPAAGVPYEPRPGDVLVESNGRRWTVLDVGQATLRTRWRCICRDLAIAGGLDQEIQIEKAVYRKTPGGVEEAVWQTWRSGVQARIQPIAVETAGAHDRDATVARFRVFCAEDLPLDHTYRIKDHRGAMYRILACRKAERIDALLEIDAVRA